jgi:Fe-S cluster biogenesis protein NfuA
VIELAQIETVVDELQTLLESDGAHLVVLEVDPSLARVVVELDLSAAECADCVVSPRILESIVRAQLEACVREEFELVLLDPRSVEPEEGERVLPEY